MSEKLILVDYNDRPIGTCEKMEAHRKGLLHRAFSVFLFDGSRVLLQKRAAEKYHCPGLWTNTCCSHPRPGETVEEAAKRRICEELGIENCVCEEAFRFFYRYAFDNGLIEFECDHVFIGSYPLDGLVVPNKEEVDEAKWWELDELLETMASEADLFTPWFLICAPRAIEIYRQKNE